MKQETLSRRKMLKTLVAAGGAVGAASFLPEKWLKPVVQSGVLPAHAAASVVCTYKTVLYDWNEDCDGWESYNEFCEATAPYEGKEIVDNQFDGDDYTYTYKSAGIPDDEYENWDNPGPGYYYLEDDPSSCTGG